MTRTSTASWYTPLQIEEVVGVPFEDLGVPPRKSLGVRLSAASPHSSFLLACGLSAAIRHAEIQPLNISSGLLGLTIQKGEEAVTSDIALRKVSLTKRNT